MNTTDLFDSFNRLKALVIGDVMLDSYIWGAVERISPEAPVPIVNVRKKRFSFGWCCKRSLKHRGIGCTTDFVRTHWR